MATYADKTVKNKVYLNCWNKSDVIVVQQLLNALPVRWGGPATPLVANGTCDVKTVDAIKTVQRRYFAFEDGAIDATNSKTLQILNEMNRHIAEHGKPTGGEVGGDVAPAVACQTQSAGMLCWATAMAMLQSWWYRETWSPLETVSQAGDDFYELLRAEKGLTDDTEFVKDFLTCLDYNPLDGRLTANNPVGWRAFLAEQPVAVMLRKSWGYHVRVAFGLKTDGTLYGTSVHIADPDGGRVYWEAFHKFARLYTASAGMAGARIWGW